MQYEIGGQRTVVRAQQFFHGRFHGAGRPGIFGASTVRKKRYRSASSPAANRKNPVVVSPAASARAALTPRRRRRRTTVRRGPRHKRAVATVSLATAFSKNNFAPRATAAAAGHAGIRPAIRAVPKNFPAVPPRRQALRRVSAYTMAEEKTP